MATLEVRSLARRFPGAATGLADVAFTVDDGRICAVLGPAGGGKTTLLRAIAGLERPVEGDVRIAGLSILDRPTHRRGVGLMFQDLALFPHLTVRENIAFGLRMVGWPRAERRQRVSDLLEVVGLSGLGDRRIDELTGGEQQRIALARTLAPHPSVLLLDEPLGAIDDVQKVALRQELRSILNALEVTAVITTHDLHDAIAIADDLVVLEDGHVLQAGPIGVVLGEPASMRVAELAGYITLAHGPIRRGRVEEPGVGTMAVPGLPDAEAARIMAHPASLLAVPADSGLGSGVAGLVVRARAIGPTWVVDLSVGGRLVEARWEWDLVAPRAGSRLAIAARPGTLRVFSSTLAEIAGAPATATPAAPTPARPQPAPPHPAADQPAAAATPPTTEASESVPPPAAPEDAAAAVAPSPAEPVAAPAPPGELPASAVPPPTHRVPPFAPLTPRPAPSSAAAPAPLAAPTTAPEAPPMVPPASPEPAPAPASTEPEPAVTRDAPDASMPPRPASPAPGLPPSALPPTRGSMRTALPPTVRGEQHHRQMPLS